MVDFAKRCGRWALPLGASLSMFLLLCVADACVCFRGLQSGYYSFTDRLHLVTDAAGPSRIARVIVCNSDLLVAAKYAEFTRQSGNPPNGISYTWPGFHHWRINYDGSRTYWFVAVSLWCLIALASVLPIIWIGGQLWRRRFQFSLRTLLIFMVSIAFYLGVWSLTATVGTRGVTEQLAESLSVDGRSPRIDHELFFNVESRQCHFAGNATSPFPFVVMVDYGYIVYHRLTDGRLGYPEDREFRGERGRACFFWFLGYKHKFEHWSLSREEMVGEGALD